MLKHDAQEALPIAVAVVTQMLAAAPTQGRSGSDFRTAVGDFLANALKLIQADAYGPPLANIFDMARLAGITFPQLDDARMTADATTPQTVGAILVKDTLIELSLATEVRIIADMTFTSRDEVTSIQTRINAAFKPMEEDIADEMDSTIFMALISAQAAVIAHLTETARPLPRMLNYQFTDIYSTLVIGYKLYSDASRCDELRAENDIVHPLFVPLTGKALST